MNKLYLLTSILLFSCPATDKDKLISDLEIKHETQEEIIKITNDFKTLPTYSEVNNFVNDSLKPPVPVDNKPLVCVPVQRLMSRKGSPIELNSVQRGARKLLSNLFQSCDAINYIIDENTPYLSGVINGKVIDGKSNPSGGKLRKITNANSYVNSHVVLSKLKNDKNYPKEGCKNMLKSPPVYGYGSRAYNSNGKIKLFHKGRGVAAKSHKATGIDCSSFVSVALASQGLKVKENSGIFQDNTTSSFHSIIDSSKSCLNSPKFDFENSLASGDIINVRGKHVIIIDTVGPDPLGIQKHASENKCSEISPKDFDFTFIHSGSVKNSYGPSRVMASTYKKNPSLMFQNLVALARDACARLKGTRNKISTKNLKSGSRFKIARHNSSNPKCVGEPKRMEGQSCVDHCF